MSTKESTTNKLPDSTGEAHLDNNAQDFFLPIFSLKNDSGGTPGSDLFDWDPANETFFDWDAGLKEMISWPPNGSMMRLPEEICGTQTPLPQAASPAHSDHDGAARSIQFQPIVRLGNTGSAWPGSKRKRDDGSEFDCGGSRGRNEGDPNRNVRSKHSVSEPEEKKSRMSPGGACPFSYLRKVKHKVLDAKTDFCEDCGQQHLHHECAAFGFFLAKFRKNGFTIDMAPYLPNWQEWKATPGLAKIYEVCCVIAVIRAFHRTYEDTPEQIACIASESLQYFKGKYLSGLSVKDRRKKRWVKLVARHRSCRARDGSGRECKCGKSKNAKKSPFGHHANRHIF